MSQTLTASGSTLEPPIDTKMPHLPGLDGLRGVALVIVLLYHHGVTWMTGGELTVSMFFTLSGFLITRLVVNEWAKSGTISLKNFYDRRIRRLFPASFFVLMAVVIIWTLFPGSGRRLAFWEWMSGMSYFENFYLQSAGKSYGGLFGLGNPVQHLWSLSLEEQVYLVFPVLCLLMLRGRYSRAAVWRFFKVLSGLALLGILLGAYNRTHLPLWSHLPVVEAKCSDSSCAYYATEVRVGEFLMGSAFAVFWSVWSYVPRATEFLRRPIVAILSWPFLIIAYIVWFKIGWRNQWGDVFFPWSVFFNAFITMAFIALAHTGVGMGRLLAWKPAAWMGQVTYTVYLVHWPTFMFWDSMRLNLDLPKIHIPLTDWETTDGFWHFVFKIAITFTIVCLIYYLLENPVRKKKIWKGSRLYVWLVAMTLVGVIFAVVGNDRRTSATDVLAVLDEQALAMQKEALASLPDLGENPPDVSPVDPALPARMMMVGDSQSWVLAAGLDDWEASNQVINQPSPGVGCGIGENTRLKYLGIDQDKRPGCTEWRDALGPIVQKFQPNVVIIVGGGADLSDRQIPGVEGWSHIGEPQYDTWLLQQFAAFTDIMTSSGSMVIWFSMPLVDPPYVSGETGKPPFAEGDPVRTQRYNELIEQFADSDERVVFADLAAQVKAHPGGEFEPKMRPDRTHIDLKYAPELVEWIDATIRDAYATR